jgi:diaminopimelate epimerase
MTPCIPFYKYHALGNDYIVVNPSEIGTSQELDAARIQSICHRNFGVGSDGILFGPLPDPVSGIALQIFNPDGSEAEKSGNGLRIFARYLWDKGLVKDDPVQIKTAGGPVIARVHTGGKTVSVQMGRVSFDSQRIPVKGPAREVLNEPLKVGAAEFSFCAATVGNPHCVIIREVLSKAQTLEFGPLIENEPRFPNRTNVQFMKILDRSNIQIEIWERGAGYTLASGSSSSAAAAVAFRLGLCDSRIQVHMPGGEIDIEISDDYDISMAGAVTRVAEGSIDPEMFEQ